MEGPLTDQMIKQKYQEELEREKERKDGEGGDKEGLSEMVAEELRNRGGGGASKKRKGNFKSDQKAKKSKEDKFKF